jgi:anti-sigma B factor antagonist
MAIVVETEEREGWKVVHVAGEIDLRTAPELRERLATLLDEGADRLVVDLEQVHFIDSTALSVMVGAHKRLVRQGAVLHLATTGVQVGRVLAITGLSRVFAVHDTVDEALGSAP